MAASIPQLLREAIASYFGGTLVPNAAGPWMYYEGGPLVSFGLGAAYAYHAKRVPDTAYFLGMAAGRGMGSIMLVRLGENSDTRQSIGGPTSGWRDDKYAVIAHLFQIAQVPHAEQAGADLDDLITQVKQLMYNDRTLGTTNPTLYGVYGGRLIMQAGEGPRGIQVTEPEAEVVGDVEERLLTTVEIKFDASVYVQA